MTDPRNIAHAKKVQQEKKHHGEEAVAGAEHVPQPSKKPHLVTTDKTDASDDETSADQPRSTGH